MYESESALDKAKDLAGEKPALETSVLIWCFLFFPVHIKDASLDFYVQENLLQYLEIHFLKVRAFRRIISFNYKAWHFNKKLNFSAAGK